ncbi:conserved hypothetical protein [Thermotomaculum hydrothermale]|uniref:DUF523 domain-containing protein n=1 Tax=Thermotomaculum hydrothermale TaxID=981385 RepID=A0A7R6SYX1_9BACT|nr:conserved hypothetical protein [Thermotomaculum hydrothermale]
MSACLCGVRCRYNGKILEKRDLPVNLENVILICPETLAGLRIPRTPSFFDNEKTGEGVLDGETKVVSIDGEDRTEEFLKGSKKALEIARKYGVKKAYLKERSPSCGVNTVYVNNKRTNGMGVTAALFEREGIEVIGVN